MSGVFARKDPFCLLITKIRGYQQTLAAVKKKDDRIRGREEKMKETGRIKLKRDTV